MTQTPHNEQSAGEIAKGLHETTTSVVCYCPREKKREWEEEVEKYGFRSLSEYIYCQVEQSRWRRE